MRNILASLILATLLLSGAAQAGVATLKSDRSQCYKYLTELVRSSNFPFAYVKKEQANLLIDDDQGASVSAQVVFDTDGAGTIGWIKYDIQNQILANISADLDEPEILAYDKQYAEQYERCIVEG